MPAQNCIWPYTLWEDNSNHYTRLPWYGTSVWSYYFSPHTSTFVDANGNQDFNYWNC
jgi:hypothetical protein